MPTASATELGQHPDLGGSLVVFRSDEADVDAFLDLDALGPGGGMEERLAKARAPGLGEVGKAPRRSPARCVRWGVLAGQVDVIADDHQRPGPEGRIQAARGVGSGTRPARRGGRQSRTGCTTSPGSLPSSGGTTLEHHDGRCRRGVPRRSRPACPELRRGRPSGKVGEDNRDAILRPSASRRGPSRAIDSRARASERARTAASARRGGRAGRWGGWDLSHVGGWAIRGHAGLQRYVQGSTAGARKLLRPTEVPTPGCRSHPAGRPPGDGHRGRSRPGNEAPEATGPERGFP